MVFRDKKVSGKKPPGIVVLFSSRIDAMMVAVEF
jgi:hypothetical protein